MKLFDYDSGLMRVLGKISDLVIVNLMAIICCIPLVTIGASITALHYSILKMKRDTDNYPFRNFWKSFKQNLLQSTAIWLIEVLAVGISIFALLIMSGAKGTFNSIVSGVILAGLLIILIMSTWVYALQARFVNKVMATIRNSFFLGLRYFFRSLYMLLTALIPIAVIYFGGFKWFSLVILFGLSLPIFLNVFAYDKVFVKLEEQILAQQEAENGTEEKELGPWEAAEKRAEEEWERERQRNGENIERK